MIEYVTNCAFYGLVILTQAKIKIRTGWQSLALIRQMLQGWRWESKPLQITNATLSVNPLPLLFLLSYLLDLARGRRWLEDYKLRTLALYKMFDNFLSFLGKTLLESWFSDNFDLGRVYILFAFFTIFFRLVWMKTKIFSLFLKIHCP